MTNDLESGLTAWMQSVEVPPAALAALREIDLPARGPRRVGLRLLGSPAMAALVLAVGAITIAIASFSIGRHPAVPVPSGPAATTVPCQASDLDPTGETVGSALGNAGAIVRLKNVGAATCVVGGYPTLALVAASGQHLATDSVRATDGDYLFPAMPETEVVLRRGDVAAFQIGYPANPSGPDTSVPLEVACPPATGLEVALPGFETVLAVAIELSPCEGHLNVSPVHAGGTWVGFSEPGPTEPGPTEPGPTEPLGTKNPLAEVSLASMAWFDRQHGLFVGGTGGEGSEGTVWRTADGGRSWTAVDVPGGRLGVVTISGPTAWAGSTCSLPAPCKNALLRSDDGGASWTRVTLQPVAALAFADARHAWAIAFSESSSSGPTLMESTDGGATWNPRRSPCPKGTGIPVALSFPSPAAGWLACNETFGAGSAAKAILETTDGSQWTLMAALPAPDAGPKVGRIDSSGYLTGLSMAASGSGMYWADRGVSERTADRGTTWTGMTATSFDLVIASTGWAIDQDDWLLYAWNGDAGRFILEESTDGGSTWQEAAGFTPPS